MFLSTRLRRTRYPCSQPHLFPNSKPLLLGSNCPSQPQYLFSLQQKRKTWLASHLWNVSPNFRLRAKPVLPGKLRRLQKIVSTFRKFPSICLRCLKIDYRSFSLNIVRDVGSQNENVVCFLACAFGTKDRYFLWYKNQRDEVVHCKHNFDLKIPGQLQS